MGPPFAGGAHRRSRMRNFNWETLPKHTVIGKHNIWTVDKTDGEYELDTDHMEELFSHKQAQQQNKAVNRQSLRGVPTSVKQLVNFKGDSAALPEADLFMLMLVRITCYEERLSCLVLKEEFFPLTDEVKEFIRTLTAAGRELLDCDNLHAVIRLVLKTGNYMNAGGYAGNAVGFKMSSLLKLVDTKANKPGMNLMHYVVMQAQKVDMALLKFPEQLKHTEPEAEVCLNEVEADLQELQSVSDSVAQYFCEDSKNFRLEECCSIFNSFCEKFLRAIQENKARETAEVKRRHRDRLEITAKRRSTATCSSRDKEMDSIALESLLQNFATKRSSRRRTGKPSSTHGSPLSASPNSRSLSEIISQANLPPANEKVITSLRAKDMGRKEWSSAAESFVDEEEEEDLQDNNEEEAQKLREASKKVLRFQNSRGSVSSGEHPLENQKSPGPSTTMRRQLTFDEETDRYPDDPTNDDLLQVLLNPQPSPKRNLGRRHTLPTKVPKTEKGEDNQWAERKVKTPNHVAQEKGTVPERGGAGHPVSKPVFDFTDISHNLKQSGTQDPISTSAENKTKPLVPLAPVTQPANSHLERSSENVPSNTTKPVVFKTETTGLFFSFFKRLGDMSKLQSSRESNKATGTGV
uniref:FH2 domain containing 4 n=1 Tax=Amphilophus citrinellus TaxID=61819 RepID=A0A3Q0R568_AMPCI